MCNVRVAHQLASVCGLRSLLWNGGPFASHWLLRREASSRSAGVMNGGRTVTKDTCLYAENYAFTLARERTNGTQQTAIVVRRPSTRCMPSPQMCSRCPM